MSATRYPLAWPTGWRRTSANLRQPGRFGTEKIVGPPENSWKRREAVSIATALMRLDEELRRLGVLDGDWLVSSNLRTRIDGLPYSNQQEPFDIGVAVYFRIGRNGTDMVLACDRWTRTADNIAAIAGHIKAIRAIDRYGVGSIEQAFAGYQALPAKGATWRTTLGFDPDEAVSLTDVDEAYRARAREAHPDAGGSHDAMSSLNAARDEAREELRAHHEAAASR